MRNAIAIGVGLLTASWLVAMPVHAEATDAPSTPKPMKVFILAGQSNMEGRTDARKLSEADRERLKAVQGRVQLAFNFQKRKPLDVVKPHQWIKETYKVDHIFGPELFFGIRMAEAWPKERLLLIKRTEGGTSLYGCWNADWSKEKAAVMGEADRPGLYKDLMTYVRDVLSGYEPGEYEIEAVLWVQGERDAKNATAAAAYGENLQRLVARLREDLDDPELPFLLFQVGNDAVVAGMKSVAESVPNVTLIPQSLDPDSPDFYEKIPNGHYNHAGQRKLGLRFASEYRKRYAEQSE